MSYVDPFALPVNAQNPLAAAEEISKAAAPVIEASQPEPTQAAAPVEEAAPAPTEPVPEAPLKVATFHVSRQFTTHDPSIFNQDDEETLSLPSGTMEETRNALRDTPNVDAKKADASLLNYTQVITDGLQILPYAKNYQNLFTRYGSNYVQVVETVGGKIGPFSPKLRLKEGVKPTGDAARELVRAKLNLGGRWTVPLYHSGFNVTLSAVPDSELLDLFEEIDREKTVVGRHTYGNALSNNTSYSDKIFMDFVEAHLLETSLAIPEGKSLRDYVLNADFQRMMWGMACLVWPNGFQYRQACITDVEKCKHIHEARLALQRLDWVDDSALTERQKAHMLKRERNSVTVEEIKIYQAEFTRGSNRKVKLPGGIEVIFKMATVADHINHGYRWIGEIEERFTTVLTKEIADRERYLMEQAQATSMRQYSHLVKAFVVDDVEIDILEDIEGVLNDLTVVDNTREAFIEEALKFIEDSTIAGVGMPTYQCPNCGGNQRPHNRKDVEGKYPEIIPLDISQLFFQLLLRRVIKIRQR